MAEIVLDKAVDSIIGAASEGTIAEHANAATTVDDTLVVHVNWKVATGEWVPASNVVKTSTGITDYSYSVTNCLDKKAFVLNVKGKMKFTADFLFTDSTQGHHPLFDKGSTSA